MKTIHIGDKIKELLAERKMTVVQLAKRIGISSPAVYKMLKKATIHQKWFDIISDKLGHNLYRYYCGHEQNKGLSAEVQQLEEQNSQLKTSLQAAAQQAEALKKENQYLKKINALLEAK